MKIARLERLRQLQLEYHRSHQWRLSHGGLYIRHSYTDVKSDSLSYWDDVGFILNGRRIMVWWVHPRYVYSEAIQEKAWEEAGPNPRDNGLTEGGTKNYKRVGRSRKKLVSTSLRKPSPEQQQYYDLLNDISARLSAKGIDLEVPTSWKWERLKWAMGVSLVAPMEIRNEGDLALLANLARRLVLEQTTLQEEYPDYRYGRADWLREQGELAAAQANERDLVTH